MTSKKLVFGVGIKDADYYTQKKKVINLDDPRLPEAIIKVVAAMKEN